MIRKKHERSRSLTECEGQWPVCTPWCFRLPEEPPTWKVAVSDRADGCAHVHTQIHRNPLFYTELRFCRSARSSSLHTLGRFIVSRRRPSPSTYSATRRLLERWERMVTIVQDFQIQALIADVEVVCYAHENHSALRYQLLSLSILYLGIHLVFTQTPVSRARKMRWPMTKNRAGLCPNIWTVSSWTSQREMWDQ